MTIYENSPDGAAVYRETIAKVTNTFGLVNIVIGQGTPVIGSFAAVNWGKNAFYLETAVDLAGGGQFSVLGVTQFLSVPYSLYSGQSGGILSMTNQERNALEDPPVGMQIYNTTTNCLNYYSGSDWYETCGNLVLNEPPVQPFSPGPPDNYSNVPLEVVLTWYCTDPENDPMVFDVYFGNSNPPPLAQNSVTETGYTVSQLEFGMTYFWKIVAHDNHGNVTQGPVWSFQTMMCLLPQVYAGENATICRSEVYQLSGVVQSPNSNFGGWTNSGDGTFSNPSIPNPVYIPGILDVQNGYAALTLTAYAAEPCPPFPGYDDMTLILQPYPYAHAGYDQTVCWNEAVNLSDAFAESYSLIQWNTPDGAGFFEDETQPNTVYYPSPSIDYPQGCIHLVIDAYPITPCTIFATDTMHLCFYNQVIANAGTDQPNHAGSSTTLAGNTPPSGGYGVWSISNGTGGSIAQPNNPTSTFTGVAGNSYSLRWTLYSLLGCNNYDEVAVSFASTWACGQSFTDTRDGKVYTTMQIGAQCWMNQNLNIGTRIAGTSNQTNKGTSKKYCYSNTEANCTTYGGLYQWDEMMQYTTTAGVKGICPTGWQLPTDTEWTSLATYLGGESVAGGKMKETGITHWTSPNTGATNSSGFTGLPGGYRSPMARSTPSAPTALLEFYREPYYLLLAPDPVLYQRQC